MIVDRSETSFNQSDASITIRKVKKKKKKSKTNKPEVEIELPRIEEPKEIQLQEVPLKLFLISSPCPKTKW